jgi:hypothetical protein
MGYTALTKPIEKISILPFNNSESFKIEIPPVK